MDDLTGISEIELRERRENPEWFVAGYPKDQPECARIRREACEEHVRRMHVKEASERAKAEANAPPVDRAARVLVSGNPVPEDGSHTELKSGGQQKDYVVLSAEERAKGFVRPVRLAYIHVGKPTERDSYSRFEYPIRGGVKPFPGGCLTRTQMAQSIAETYSRDPAFYSGTFCCSCGVHKPLEEFIWEGTTERVGS
jgi:hypothetical protein